MKRMTFAAMLAVLFVTAGGASAVIRGLPSPEHVSPETQSALKARMGRHGATMQDLVRAVVLLDRPTIRLLAQRIADDDLMARINNPPLDRKGMAVPRDLFREQSTLSEAARQLAAAADGSDDHALADRFAALTKTCVTCHSVYLHGRPDPSPTGPGAK